MASSFALDCKVTENYLERIRQDNKLLPGNKSLIVKFFNEKLASGKNPSGLYYYLKILYRLSKELNKPLEEITKDELIDFFVNVKPEPVILKTKYGSFPRVVGDFSPVTLQLYKTSTKTFYHWLFKGKTTERDERGYPLVVSWISSSKKVKGKYQKDILTRDEVNKMISLAQNPRDKALIAALFETGMRASELLGMELKNLKEQEGYGQITCNGKTGEREVVFVKSWPFLQNWLNWLKENQDIIADDAKDLVWINLPKVGIKRKGFLKGGKLMNRDNVCVILKRIAKKAGIQKRIWTHGFRHSSATDFAKQGYNETEMRLKFGWTPASNIPSNYTHYHFDDLVNKMLSRSGKKVQVECSDGNILATKECPFCSRENPKDSKYCSQCSRPLDIQTIKKQEKSQAAYKFINNLVEKIEDLQAKGIDIKRVNEAIEEWVKQ